MKWYAWVGATVLAFYGAGRLGEILSAAERILFYLMMYLSLQVVLFFFVYGTSRAG